MHVQSSGPILFTSPGDFCLLTRFGGSIRFSTFHTVSTAADVVERDGLRIRQHCSVVLCYVSDYRSSSRVGQLKQIVAVWVTHVTAYVLIMYAVVTWMCCSVVRMDMFLLPILVHKIHFVCASVAGKFGILRSLWSHWSINQSIIGNLTSVARRPNTKRCLVYIVQNQKYWIDCKA